MSIRRISELPNIFSEHPDASLSDCLFEVSYYLNSENAYRSYYTTGNDLMSDVTNLIQNIDIENIKITKSLDIVGGTINITEGGSILAWPNGDDVSQTCCYLHFGDIKLSSETNMTLNSGNGYPVVINDNLSVYRDQTKTEKPVYMNSTSNQINAQTVQTTQYAAAENRNKVVTCELLNNVVGNIDSVLARLNG